METAPSRRVHPALWFVAGVAVVSFAAAGAAFLLRDRTPRVTDADVVERSFDRWRERRLDDYDLRLRKEADRIDDERYEVTVRGGEVSRLTRNGREVQASSYYSVEGLFEVLRRELEMASSPEHREGQRANALVKASFHEELGVPLVIKVFAGSGRSFVLTVEEIETPDKGRIYPAGAPGT